MGTRLGTQDPQEKIRIQYQQAEEFLRELADILFEGDRSRVVLCAGNHDVNWCRARDAMAIVPQDEIPSDVLRELATPGSLYRWDWETRTLYQIVDVDTYHGRMNDYWEFIERFYSGTELLHRPHYGDRPLLVELFDRRILVAAFNSCEGNDCYRNRAEINVESAARVHLDLQNRPWEYGLRIAVWHHNTAGPPNADDYLHIDQVHTLIECGFRLGLHGHQHRSELRLHTLALPAYGSMAVVSAGSLAAGSPELPRGTNRQYNMIELREDLRGARLHVREIELGAFGPRRLNSFGGHSFVDMAWDVVPSPVGTIVDWDRLNQSTIIDQAEEAHASGDDDQVLDLLRSPAATLDSYGRKLLVDSAERSERWDVIVDELSPPRTIEESALLVKAAVRQGAFDIARATVNHAADTLGLSPPQVHELLEWIATEEAVR